MEYVYHNINGRKCQDGAPYSAAYTLKMTDYPDPIDKREDCAIMDTNRRYRP